MVDGLDALVHELERINRLFLTDDGVTKEPFHTFTTPMLQRSPYIKSLGPPVSADFRTATRV